MHALSLGHPVMGDSLYGTEYGKANSDRLLLHARKLCFPHVSTPRPTRVTFGFCALLYSMSNNALIMLEHLCIIYNLR